jgi:hypothetical protein
MNTNLGKRHKQAVQVLNTVDYNSDGNPVGLKEDSTNPLSANFGTEREPLRGGCYRSTESCYIDLGGYRPDLAIQNFRIEFYWKVDERHWDVPIQINYNNTSNSGVRITQSYYKLIFASYNENGYISPNINIDCENKGWQKIRYDVYGGYVYSYINDIPYNFGELDAVGDGAGLGTTIQYVDDGITQLFSGFQSGRNIFGFRYDELDISGNYIQTLAKYNCSEHFGDVSYDSSGNGYHGDIINAITTTPEEDPNSIHQYQDIYSFENEEGYSDYNFDILQMVGGYGVSGEEGYAPLRVRRDMRLFVDHDTACSGFSLLYYWRLNQNTYQFNLNKDTIGNYPFIAGKTYRFILNVESISTGSFQLRIGNNSAFSSPVMDSTGIKIFDIELTSLPGYAEYIQFGSTSCDAYMTLISIEEVDSPLYPFAKDVSITSFPFKDILNNDLQYQGKVPGKVNFVQSNCFQGYDAFVYAEVLNPITLTGNWKFSFYTRKDTSGRSEIVSGDGTVSVFDKGFEDALDSNYKIYDNLGNLIYNGQPNPDIENENDRVGNVYFIEVECTGTSLIVSSTDESDNKYTETISVSNPEFSIRYFGKESYYNRYSFVNSVFGFKAEQNGIEVLNLPFCEPIVDPSNHTYYDVSGNGNHAILVNGTDANEGKQDEFHYLQKGFSGIVEHVLTGIIAPDADYSQPVHNVYPNTEYVIKLYAENVEDGYVQFHTDGLPSEATNLANGYQEITFTSKDFSGNSSSLVFKDFVGSNAGGLIRVYGIYRVSDGEPAILTYNDVIPCLNSDNSLDARGNTVSINQNGQSFLNTGTKLKAYDYPALKQAEQISRYWTDSNDTLLNKEFSDFEGIDADGRVYNDISHPAKIQNIRTYPLALNCRQSLTEKKLTNN